MKFLFYAAVIALIVWAVRGARPKRGMSLTEAAKLLDVANDADPETILAAHKRLIAKVHPDAGGTAELASRINQARDTLITRKT